MGCSQRVPGQPPFPLQPPSPTDPTLGPLTLSSLAPAPGIVLVNAVKTQGPQPLAGKVAWALPPHGTAQAFDVGFLFFADKYLLLQAL